MQEKHQEAKLKAALEPLPHSSTRGKWAETPLRGQKPEQGCSQQTGETFRLGLSDK